jgi:hypothetical protein
MPDQPKPISGDDKTIPSRPESLRRIVAQAAQTPSPSSGGATAFSDGGKHLPWALAQYFDGDIDLGHELAAHFPQMPLLSQISFRVQGAKQRHPIATISTQDGAAGLRVEIDPGTRAAHFIYTFNSMLALRFSLNGLSDLDRAHWLEPFKREQGEVAFLWGAQRFRSDYVIAVPHKMYTNLFAFSPHHTEAAARLTVEVSRKFIAWIEPLWMPADDSANAASTTLAW